MTLYVLGLGFGPILAAPISETLGRRVVYLGTFPPAILFILGSGFAQNFGTLLVCRFFTGLFSAPSIAVGAGSMSDLWPPMHRAAASGFFILMPFLGPAMGPPIGGYAAMEKGESIERVPLLLCILYCRPNQNSLSKTNIHFSRQDGAGPNGLTSSSVLQPT